MIHPRRPRSGGHQEFREHDFVTAVHLLVFAGRLTLFLALPHRARAAFVASSFLSSGERAAMRFFPPLPPAAFPPFLPISRITSEIRSRLIRSSYEERAIARHSSLLTHRFRFAKLYATCATGM